MESSMFNVVQSYFADSLCRSGNRKSRRQPVRDIGIAIHLIGTIWAMATNRDRAARFIEALRARATDPGDPLIPACGESLEDFEKGRGLRRGMDEAAVRSRLEAAGAGDVLPVLLDADTKDRLDEYDGVVEGFVGTAKIPIGLVGPLPLNGLHARGSFWVPLATSEAALVSSYTRGARAICRSGGACPMLLAESVARSPCFEFDRALTAARFIEWMIAHDQDFRAEAEATSNHARLDDLRFTLEGNRVYVCFEYTTGDAAGQNMTTIATEAACAWIIEHSPIAPAAWYLEANMSGDKKASSQSYCLVRGRKVTVDVVVPADVLREELRVDAEQMCHYWRVSAMGGVLSGTLGVQGHFANGLAGLFIATGQDVACVAESAIGVTRFEQRDNGELYASVTLPNLVLGTVGGGTHLPSADACLRLLGIERNGGAAVLAEVAAATLLAGELSLVAAMATGSFGRAHRLLRKRRVSNPIDPNDA